ncbi:hypothetical protein BD779DRAFT_1482835 [Infundibulicybe gibba]|nr:hypothetical protein BD779DRAFT_1482835 [Infundibulicybe gibba]
MKSKVVEGELKVDEVEAVSNYIYEREVDYDVIEVKVKVKGQSQRSKSKVESQSQRIEVEVQDWRSILTAAHQHNGPRMPLTLVPNGREVDCQDWKVTKTPGPEGQDVYTLTLFFSEPEGFSWDGQNPAPNSFIFLGEPREFTCG